MSVIADSLISIIGKGVNDPNVLKVIADNRLYSVFEAPPDRKYVGSEELGVDLVCDDENVISIQIFAEPQDSSAAFPHDLPYGLRRGMAQSDVHRLLGDSSEMDLSVSKYNINSRKVSIVYDSGIIFYINIGILEV